MSERLTRKTIEDFGDQWSRYTDNEGYYGSLELFRDIVEPLVPLGDFAGARVAEIGSGTGRIVLMALDAGAKHVTAIEPSQAADALLANVAERMDRVTILRAPGEAIPPDGQYDIVLSIGVIHHIADPEPVIDAAMRALKPGGRLLIWLYGKEGNEIYLAIFQPLRMVTTLLPHPILKIVCAGLTVALSGYIAVARFLPVPMRSYMTGVLAHFSWHKRYLTIYDQLNPAHAKYYKRSEAENLLFRAGFEAVRLYHRHGYSWTAVGTKPR